MSHRVLESLNSARLARRFVAEYVVPKVRRRGAILIAMRKVRVWGIPDPLEGTVVYTGGEARAAHLTPGSRGGRAIVEHL